MNNFNLLEELKLLDISYFIIGHPARRHDDQNHIARHERRYD